MGFEMPHICVLIALICLAVALLFQIVGIATAGWLTGEGALSDYGAGLWSLCIDDTCSDYSVIPNWLEEVQAFGIIGLLLIVASLVAGVVFIFVQGRDSTITKVLPFVAAGLAFGAALCLLIEFAIFSGEWSDTFNEDAYDLGYSFALTVVAFLLSAGAGVAFLLFKFLA